MSQYPSPYQYPQGPWGNYLPPDPRSPARRAALLMFVLAGLVGLGGVCCFGFGVAFPRIIEQNPQLMQAAGDVDSRLLQMVFAISGAAQLVGAAVLATLGVFVRRGGLGAVITSLVLVGMVILLIAANLVSVAVGQGDPQQKAGALCVTSVPLILFVALAVMLIQAAKAAPQVRQMRDYEDYWRRYPQGHHPQQGWPQAQPMPPQTPPPPPQPGDQNGPTPQR